MTMTWTAQTGLGPRTVALSLKVFIVVMLYERLDLCTAQQTLPEPLPNFLQEMRDHFCRERIRCGNRSVKCGEWNSPKRLCRQICTSYCSDKCWNTTQVSLEDAAPGCKMDQNRICGYSDATVCQYIDGRGTCVYSKDQTQRSTEKICVCQNQTISDTGSCKRQETTTSSMSDQTTETKDSGEVNIKAIVLCTIFAIVSLIFLMVYLVKRRRNQTPQRTVTTNPTNSSVVISAVSAPLVPCEGENEYEDIPMDHKTVHDDATDHVYGNVKSNQQQRGGPSGFVKRKHGPPRMPNLPAGSHSVEGGGRKAPKLPTKDSEDVYEIPDVKTTTKATGVTAFRAVNDASNEILPDEDKPIENTDFERM